MGALRSNQVKDSHTEIDSETHDRLIKMGLIKSILEWEDDLREYYSPNVPEYVLNELANSMFTIVRQRVAAHKNTPVETLRRLEGSNSHDTVTYAIAGNPNCPIDILDRLAESDVIGARMAVASNPSTPATTLARIIEGQREWVYVAVAGNPNCSADTLAKLSQAKAASIRKAVAMNPNVQDEVLAKLKLDVNGDVAQAAARTSLTSMYENR